MKRLLCILVLLALTAGCTGCGAFDRTVYELTEYTAETEEGINDDVGYISDYAALKRAIVWLVSEHQESAELQFQNYDGNISRDLSQACWEVKSSTPLGAFAVDYTSFDLSRIVSFYQADVYITYKRSAEQMQELEQMSGLSAFARRLTQALSGGETYLVMQMTAASLTADVVEEYIRKAYYADALASPVLPRAEVNLYPDSGVERIVEITLDYGMEPDALDAMREKLETACQTAAQSLSAAGETETSGEASAEPEGDIAAPKEDAAGLLYAAAGLLADQCRYTEGVGGTAYDAWVSGEADSEALAMAFQALCTKLDLPCQTVSGRLDNKEHFWNIVTIDGVSYHIDLSALDERFLTGDDEMWGRYWWDTAAYPACPEDYNYFGQSAEPASAEPDGIPDGVAISA